MQNKKEKVRNHEYIWFSPQAITNTPSLVRVYEKYRVNYESAVEDILNIHKEDRNTPSGILKDLR